MDRMKIFYVSTSESFHCVHSVLSEFNLKRTITINNHFHYCRRRRIARFVSSLSTLPLFSSNPSSFALLHYCNILSMVNGYLFRIYQKEKRIRSGSFILPLLSNLICFRGRSGSFCASRGM